MDKKIKKPTKTFLRKVTFHHIFFTFLLFNADVGIYAQDYHKVHKQLKFNHITIDDGLTNNAVNSICQDKDGYMWFASLTGVNKYNGIENKQFVANQNIDTGLSSNVVNKVYCDTKGNIWLGTDNGLCVFNPYKQKFDKFGTDVIPDSLGNVDDIIEDSLKNIWFATSTGLYAYNLNTNESSVFSEMVRKLGGELSDTIDNLMLENGEKLWISSFKKNICIYNIKTGKLKTFFAGVDFGSDNKNIQIEDIYKDKLGYVWFGSYNDGILLFNPYDSAFSHLYVDVENVYTNRVRTFFEDKSGNLYVGTRGGIYIYNRLNNKFSLYADVKHRFSTLSNNSILSSYIDKTGGLWIGTRFGGVNYSNMERKPFVYFPAGEDDNRFLNHTSVFAFAEGDNNKIYIGTENGLNILDKKSYTFQYIVNKKGDINSLSYNDIKALSIDDDENIWIATNNGGLNHYHAKTGNIKQYRHHAKNPASLESDKVYYVLNDKNGDLWAISNQDRENKPSTLSYLKKGSENFVHYKDNFYGGLYEKSDGNLLIGGNGSFHLLDRNSNSFIEIKNDSLIGKVLCLYEDVKGNVWVGSDYGLTCYDLKSNQFSQFSVKTGFPIHEVCGILSDEELSLWVSTNYGLIKLQGVIEDPRRATYKVYTKNDGLQSKQFNANACMKSKSGEMYFGGINGFNSFFPDKIRDNKYRPEVVFSGVKIGNHVVNPGERVHKKVIIGDILNESRRVTIPASIQTFTICFDAMHFSNPVENKFKYKLEGFDNDWVLSNAYNNFVTYTELPDGEYRLKVIALNSDGLESENIAGLTIVKLPYFWNMRWFQVAILVFLIAGGFFLYRIRIYRLRIQKIILAKKVKQKTSELEDSYLKLQERQNEVLAQNEEIKAQNEEIYQQNEEIVAQRDEIQRKSDELELSYEKTKVLNEIGKKITAFLSMDQINNTIYDYIASMMDASVFGLGIYNKEKNGIVFSNLKERDNFIPEFISSLDDPTSLAAYCFNKQEITICNDFETEYKSFISEIKVRSSIVPKSLIYVPITANKKKIGVFTVQSYNYDAYRAQDIHNFESLASFIAIAIDNTWAYDHLKEQNEEIEKHRTNLSKMVYERTRELEKALIKAEESDKLKTAFLANMSHEIRTPLNAIIGFLEVMGKEDIGDSEKKKLFPMIQSSGFYLSNLINDIIDFSKIESNQLEINTEVLNVKSELENVHATFVEEVKRNNNYRDQHVEIRISGIEPVDLLFKCDPIRFKQILVNLIGNAIKFTGQGSIEFGIHQKDEKFITFFVKDTGIGIEEKNFNVIFERFRKIEDNIDTLYRGTGLGLAITKYLLVRLGGEIWLESELGKGTIFYFTLPVNLNDENGEVKETIEVPGFYNIPDWKNKNILIVEDEKSNFYLLETMLRKTNANLLWAKDGGEAIEMFKSNEGIIDLILMDVKLPVKNGFETAKEIKEFKNSIPIIAQTAHALPQEEYHIRNSDFDEYISKPIIKNKLIDLMSVYFR